MTHTPHLTRSAEGKVAASSAGKAAACGTVSEQHWWTSARRNMDKKDVGDISVMALNL